MNALKRLEDWIYEHKSHSCELSREDGYGANYWELRLYPPKIFAVEWCLDYDINKLQKVIETPDYIGWLGDSAVAQPTLYVTKNNNHHWCDVDNLINCALDYWEKINVKMVPTN